MADKYKSKFGHIRHFQCEVSHILLGAIQLFIVTILADKSQEVKSTRRKRGVIYVTRKSYPQPVENGPAQL